MCSKDPRKGKAHYSADQERRVDSQSVATRGDALSNWHYAAGNVDGYELWFAEHTGHKREIVYLHGLGSDWNDFSCAAWHRTLSDHKLIVPSLPGHGRSKWGHRFSTGLVAVVDVLEQIVRKRCSGGIIIVGHSLGGALAILLAKRLGEAVSGVVSVEGNLVAGDCGILSDRTAAWGDRNLSDDFFAGMDKTLDGIDLPGYGDYRRRYRLNLHSPDAWQTYTRELVTHCHDALLLNSFLKLRCNKAYIYGDATVPPPLATLHEQGVKTVPISSSSHWPMYSNSEVFLSTLGQLAANYDLYETRADSSSFLL